MIEKFEIASTLRLLFLIVDKVVCSRFGTKSYLIRTASWFRRRVLGEILYFSDAWAVEAKSAVRTPL
jgi:hypothetical protein